MGKVLLGLMRFVSRKLSARFCRVWEKLRERHGKKIKRNRDVSKIEEEGSEDDLPISGALLTFVFWMSTCAGSFMLLEPKWNFFEAFYFAFISLTTIGKSD